MLITLGYSAECIDADILEQALQIENDSKEEKEL